MIQLLYIQIKFKCPLKLLGGMLDGRQTIYLYTSRMFFFILLCQKTSGISTKSLYYSELKQKGEREHLSPNFSILYDDHV